MSSWPAVAPVRLLLPRQRNVARLVRQISRRHPEFAQPMTWRDVQLVCAREHIAIRVRHLPGNETGRLVRVGSHVSMQLSRKLVDTERAWVGAHELAHYFSDGTSEMCYFDDLGDQSPSEEFCERFAWYCVDPGAREFLHRWREEAF